MYCVESEWALGLLFLRLHDHATSSSLISWSTLSAPSQAPFDDLVQTSLSSPMSCTTSRSISQARRQSHSQFQHAHYTHLIHHQQPHAHSCVRSLSGRSSNMPCAFCSSSIPCYSVSPNSKQSFSLRCSQHPWTFGLSLVSSMDSSSRWPKTSNGGFWSP